MLIGRSQAADIARCVFPSGTLVCADLVQPFSPFEAPQICPESSIFYKFSALKSQIVLSARWTFFKRVSQTEALPVQSGKSLNSLSALWSQLEAFQTGKLQIGSKLRSDRTAAVSRRRPRLTGRPEAQILNCENWNRDRMEIESREIACFESVHSNFVQIGSSRRLGCGSGSSVGKGGHQTEIEFWH